MKCIEINTKIYNGRGSLKALNNLENKNILIVADGFLVKEGIIEKVTKNIKKSNKITIFDQVQPDPSLEIVSNAISYLLKSNSDVIIAFGGGSAIDTAKGIIYFLNQTENKRDLTFIAIPTTSGTGSEVTDVTVITDKQEKVKHLFQASYLLPNIAILDADLTKTLPKSIVANTGIDVFTHALEAYVAKGANDYSDALSEKAGQIVVDYLFRYFSDRNDLIAGEKMHMASTIAGMSFKCAGLGINHSIAHQLGGQFHIPHGLANGLLLESVIRHNSKCEKAKIKYAMYAKKIGICNQDLDDDVAVDNLVKFVQFLQKMMEMPNKIAQCRVDKQKFEDSLSEMAKNAIKDNCTKSNPMEITENQIMEILEALY